MADRRAAARAPPSAMAVRTLAAAATGSDGGRRDNGGGNGFSRYEEEEKDRGPRVYVGGFCHDTHKAGRFGDDVYFPEYYATGLTVVAETRGLRPSDDLKVTASFGCRLIDRVRAGAFHNRTVCDGSYGRRANNVEGRGNI